jgi:hypothetical protein
MGAAWEGRALVGVRVSLVLPVYLITFWFLFFLLDSPAPFSFPEPWAFGRGEGGEGRNNEKTRQGVGNDNVMNEITGIWFLARKGRSKMGKEGKGEDRSELNDSCLCWVVRLARGRFDGYCDPRPGHDPLHSSQRQESRRSPT